MAAQAGLIGAANTLVEVVRHDRLSTDSLRDKKNRQVRREDAKFAKEEKRDRELADI
jgi:hypothetical protein